MTKIFELKKLTRNLKSFLTMEGNRYLIGALLLTVLFTCLLSDAMGQPTIQSFNVDKPAIQEGDNATLIWSTNNSTNVVINPGIGDVDFNGSVTVTPVDTTTYFLTATSGLNNSTSAVTVTVIKKPPEILYFGNDAKIVRGGNVSLSWNVSRATSIVIYPEPGRVDLNNSTTVSPWETTTYTLNASNSGGYKTEDVTIEVDPVVYDFISNAHVARWGASSDTILFGGSREDPRGSATWLDNQRLDCGDVAQRVLWTHPSWVSGGWIQGSYNLDGYVINPDDHISGLVGFVDEACGPGGIQRGNVVFKVILEADEMDPRVLTEIPLRYGNCLSPFDVRIGHYAGRKANIDLRVEANGDPGYDRAVWKDVKLIRG